MGSTFQSAYGEKQARRRRQGQAKRPRLASASGPPMVFGPTDHSPWNARQVKKEGSLVRSLHGRQPVQYVYVTIAPPPSSTRRCPRRRAEFSISWVRSARSWSTCALFARWWGRAHSSCNTAILGEVSKRPGRRGDAVGGNARTGRGRLGLPCDALGSGDEKALRIIRAGSEFSTSIPRHGSASTPCSRNWRRRGFEVCALEEKRRLKEGASLRGAVR